MVFPLLSTRHIQVTSPTRIQHSALQVKLQCQKSSCCLRLHKSDGIFLESFWFCFCESIFCTEGKCHCYPPTLLSVALTSWKPVV